MIQEIQAYLNKANPEFETGFALFCKYSPNRILIESIGRRRDRDMLLYELQKLSNAGFVAHNSNAAVMQIQAAPIESIDRKPIEPDRKPIEPDRKPIESIRDSRPAIDNALEKAITFRTYDDRRTRRSDLPPELQTEFDANAADYSVRRALHEKMKLASTDKDRASLRARILETQDRINDRWKKIDSFQAKAAEEAQAAAFNEKSARAYISKALKEKTITDARAAGVRARVKALLARGCNLSENTVKQLKSRNLL